MDYQAAFIYKTAGTDVRLKFHQVLVRDADDFEQPTARRPSCESAEGAWHLHGAAAGDAGGGEPPCRALRRRLVHRALGNSQNPFPPSHVPALTIDPSTCFHLDTAFLALLLNFKLIVSVLLSCGADHAKHE